jgi:hypothetical protein
MHGFHGHKNVCVLDGPPLGFRRRSGFNLTEAANPRFNLMEAANLRFNLMEAANLRFNLMEAANLRFNLMEAANLRFNLMEAANLRFNRGSRALSGFMKIGQESVLDNYSHNRLDFVAQHLGQGFHILFGWLYA